MHRPSLRRLTAATVLAVGLPLGLLAGTPGAASASPAAPATATATSSPDKTGPQAAPATPLTIRKITLHGRAITLVTTKANVANDLARLSAVNARVVPQATNPCFGASLLCIFPDTNGGGAGLGITESSLFAPGFINFINALAPWNDQMSSWGNDINDTASRATMCWWVDINGGGAGHLMRPLGATIQNVLPSENDQASSVDTQNPTCH